jgi:hypothetical protein
VSNTSKIYQHALLYLVLELSCHSSDGLACLFILVRSCNVFGSYVFVLKLHIAL